MELVKEKVVEVEVDVLKWKEMVAELKGVMVDGNEVEVVVEEMVVEVDVEVVE